jgi:hypothetical protein
MFQRNQRRYHVKNNIYRGADKSLARPGRKQATATEDLIFIYPIYNHNWMNISTIYITRLASNEIFSSSNKIDREVRRAQDLSATLYKRQTSMHTGGIQTRNPSKRAAADPPLRPSDHRCRHSSTFYFP